MLVLSIKNTCRQHRSPEGGAIQDVCLLQLLPAFLQAWLHTLTFTIDGQVSDPEDPYDHPDVAACKTTLQFVLEQHAISYMSSMRRCACSLSQHMQAADVITRRDFRQGHVIGHPAILRLCLRAPAHYAQIDIALTFSKRLLSVFDVLPDASR